MDNTIVYPLGDSLYINLTNRCSNDCTFCIRQNKTMHGYDLWLKAEPSSDEVIAQLNSYKGFKDVVFCGYGEPTYRLSVLLDVAAHCKKSGYSVRLNTNGLGSAINNTDIAPLLKGKIDTVSISLNGADKDTYDLVSRPSIDGSFDKMLGFIASCVKNGIDTVLSAVDVIGAEKSEECRVLAAALGARFRLREFIDSTEAASTELKPN